MRSDRIAAVVVIFVIASIAWFALGKTIVERTRASYRNLDPEVQQLWGEPLEQAAPTVMADGTTVDLSNSRVKAKINLEYRRRGLLWFAGYQVDFDGEYQVKNTGATERNYTVHVDLPTMKGSYDQFLFTVDGREVAGEDGTVAGLQLKPGAQAAIHVAYVTRGLGSWAYHFGNGARHVRNFDLQLMTNFAGYDFPLETMSPTTKSGDGRLLSWKFSNLLSSSKIGIIVPQRVNPGDVASRIAYFAPLGLFFFFLVMIVWSMLKGVNLHPMHFVFLTAGFYAFHLLFAYLVDHVYIGMAFLISSAASVALVVNYMRLVTGLRFALAPTALAQIIYLVLFSYAFLFKGYTGLTVTIGAVVTLAILMQVTGKVDWESVLSSAKTARRTPPETPGGTAKI